MDWTLVVGAWCYERSMKIVSGLRVKIWLS